MFSYTSSAWFVEVHYAPFGVPFDEALARFGAGLDVEAVARLSPVLFRTRVFELEHGDYRERTFGAAFSSCFSPVPDPISARAQSSFARELERLLGRGSCVLRPDPHVKHEY